MASHNDCQRYPITVFHNPIGMKIGDRIKKERKAQSLERKDLVERSGVPYPTLAGIENGDQGSSTKIHQIAEALGVRAAWLETGRGPKKSAFSDEDDGAWPPIRATTQGAAMGAGMAADEYAEAHKLKFRAESLRRKGLRPDQLEVYYGRGDSMEPRIRDGDAVLVDKADTRIKDDRIYFIRHEGHYFVKRLQVNAGLTFIVSDNRDDPQWRKPVVVKQGDDFEVIGRVRWIGSWED